MTLALSLESSSELGDTDENGREDVGELEVELEPRLASRLDSSGHAEDSVRALTTKISTCPF